MDFSDLKTRIAEHARALGFQQMGVADLDLSQAEQRLADDLARAIGLLHRHHVRPALADDLDGLLHADLFPVFTPAVPDVPGQNLQLHLRLGRDGCNLSAGDNSKNRERYKTETPSRIQLLPPSN